MQTMIQGRGPQVTISQERPFVIIGERINPTGHKKLADTLSAREAGYILELGRQQVEAGADLLDVNVGVPGLDEVELLPWVVEVLSAEFDLPLCLDSANPQAISAALKVAPGKPMVNSVNGERASLEAVLPIVKEHGSAVIGLTLDDTGIPKAAEERVAIAGKILEHAARIGIPAEDVIIDPLVLTVGADDQAGRVTLATIEQLRERFSVNVNLGASNVSFGLPDRQVINQAFLGLGIAAGATCAITDPIKLAPAIRAIDLLLGRDPFAGRYLRSYRQRSRVGG